MRRFGRSMDQKIFPSDTSQASRFMKCPMFVQSPQRVALCCLLASVAASCSRPVENRVAATGNTARSAESEVSHPEPDMITATQFEAELFSNLKDVIQAERQCQQRLERFPRSLREDQLELLRIRMKQRIGPMEFDNSEPIRREMIEESVIDKRTVL